MKRYHYVFVKRHTHISDCVFMLCSMVSGNRPLVKSAYKKYQFSYFSTKTYVVGTQKNRLNETVFFEHPKRMF